MKVPLTWLKQFLPLTQTADEIALHLTNLGIEVETITGHETTFSGVVVGKVLAAEKHPNADRLRVARVTDGAQEYQVVCGASNCREGITVAFARIGAQLTDQDGKSWKIKKSRIRDVESEGMLCSAGELKIAGDHEGIIEFPSDLPLRIDVAAVVLGPIFDLSLTPNLGHCQSVLGIARELAASLRIKLQLLEPKVNIQGSERISVRVKDQAHCPRFACRMMSGIQVGPSPTWLQHRLIQCGLQPINNVVDVASYVMWELGQPLHIFDRDQIAEGELIIQQAPAPFSFKTLDGIQREVPVGTLLVCDREKPLSLAGIMGGLDSAATDRTQNIIIEAAAFHPGLIRRSSRLLDLKTDASTRFDRGMDPASVLKALDRATELIQKIAGGVAHPAVDHYPSPLAPRVIACRPARVEKILGLTLSRSEISELLERLDMQVTQDAAGNFHVTVPSYRNDVHIEMDLIEEIARLYGYQHIPRRRSRYSAGELPDSPLFKLEEQVRHLLLNEGLQECVTCDLISPAENALTHEKEIPDSSILHVLHPRSIDQSVLRTSLLPGFLKVAEHNFNHQEYNLALFEIGRIHFKEGEKIEEPTCAAILLSGLSRPSHFDRKPSAFDFFDLRGMIENLAHSLRLAHIQFTPSNLHALHPWRQAHIKVGDNIIGVLGEIHPVLISKSNLHGRLLFAELNLNDILGLKKQPVRFRPLVSYPSSTRDWTVTLQTSIPYAKIDSMIQACRTTHLESFEMIDSFSSQELGPDHKNVTFRFVYRDQHQTIGAETVEAEHRLLTHSVAEKLANLI